MRDNKEANKMENKGMTAILAILVLGTAGCANYRNDNSAYDNQQQVYYEPTCENGVCTSNMEYTAVCTENSAGYSECQDESNVNYTTTAAPFREYGERAPRDHRITQAAAGNNISAAIMPSIDDEVVDYEAGVASAGDTGGAISTDGSSEMAAQVQNIEDNQNKDWLAEEGQSMKELLTQWCDEAGWRLIWKTNRNYTLNAGAMFRGNFADVASALVRAFARARPAPIATFYKGNRVLVIETMEDENAFD